MNKYIDKKPPWQVGKVPEIQEKILKKLAQKEYTFAGLARELGYFIKNGKNAGKVDVARIQRPSEQLIKKGLIKKRKGRGSFKHEGKGPPSQIWRLTNKGIDSLIPFLKIDEFQKMLFLIYDEENKYKPPKSINDIRREFERKALQLDRDYVNSATFNKIFSQFQNNYLMSEQIEQEILPILEILSQKPRCGEKQIIFKLKPEFRNEAGKSIYDGNHLGLILHFDKMDEFQLSPFGLLVMFHHIFEKMIAFGMLDLYTLGVNHDELHYIYKNLSIKYKSDGEKIEDNIRFQKECKHIEILIKSLTKNYGYFFPRIFNPKFLRLLSIEKTILIFVKLYFESWIMINFSDMAEEEKRIFLNQCHMDEILRKKFKQESTTASIILSEWQKNNNWVFPVFSHVYTDVDFSVFLLAFEFPKILDEHLEFLKIIGNLDNDVVQFGIHDIHGDWLEGNDGEPLSEIYPTGDEENERFNRFYNFKRHLENLFKHYMKQLVNKSDLEYEDKSFEFNAKMLLDKFKIKNKQDAFNSIIQIKKNIKKIKSSRITLNEIIRLDEKADVLQNKSRTTRGISQEMTFYEKNHFLEDENFKVLQNIVEFQFFTYVRGHYPNVWKNLIQKGNYGDWYSGWLNKINEFKKLDQDKFDEIVQSS